MIKGLTSPKRSNISGRQIAEAIVSTENSKSMPIHLRLGHKKPAKVLSKSYKDQPKPKPTKKRLAGFSPRSPKTLNTEASELSFKNQGYHSVTLSPKGNITDLLQKSLENMRHEKAAKAKDAQTKTKEKTLKKIKLKIFDAMVRKENLDKCKVKNKAWESFVNENSRISLIKKDKQKADGKAKKKGKKKGKGKKGLKPNADNSILIKKGEIMRRLSDLSDRINSFRNEAYYSSNASMIHIEKAAIKIQSHIRGFLIRKVFAKSLQEIKNRRKSLKKPLSHNLPTVQDLQQKISQIQLRELMILKEKDLQEMSEMLSLCENSQIIAKSMEGIIERRYQILAESLQKFSAGDLETPSEKYAQPKFGEKNSDKTPKKSSQNSSSFHLSHDALHYHHASFDFVIPPPRLSLPGQPLPELLPEPDIAPPAPQLNLDLRSNSLKLDRIFFELECEIFSICLTQAISNLFSLPTSQQYPKQSKVPIRHLSPSSFPVFGTDKYSLISHYNQLLLSNPYESLEQKVAQKWSPFKILFKLDEFLLEQFTEFRYFTDPGKGGDLSAQGIYYKFEKEVIDSALSYLINKEVRMPWLEAGMEVNLEKVLGGIRKTLQDWAEVEAGKIPDMNMLTYLGNLNEDLLQEVREKNLEKIIKLDLKEEEELWVDLKYHETGIALCLEDDILIDLICEVNYILDLC